MTDRGLRLLTITMVVRNVPRATAYAEITAREGGGHLVGDVTDEPYIVDYLHGLPDKLRQILRRPEVLLLSAADLAARTEKQLLGIPGVGFGFLRAIKVFCGDAGLILAGTEVAPDELVERVITSERRYQKLRRQGILTLSALCLLDGVDLFNLGFGEHAINQLRRRLAELDPPRSLANKLGRTLGSLPLNELTLAALKKAHERTGTDLTVVRLTAIKEQLLKDLLAQAAIDGGEYDHTLYEIKMLMRLAGRKM